MMHLIPEHIEVEAIEEYKVLIERMTDSQREKFRQRIVDGKIIGHNFFLENCGCVYGTVAILISKDVGCPMIFVLEEILPRKMAVSAPITPLEIIAENARYGHGPNQTTIHAETSRWLLDKFDMIAAAL